MSMALTRQKMEGKFPGIFSPNQSARLEEMVDEVKAEGIERDNNIRDELKEELTALTKEMRQGRVALTNDTRDLKKELTALTKETRQLARHTDEGLAELAEAQRHTDDELAELSRNVGILTKNMIGLQQAVGALSNRFGFDLEEFVAALLSPYLERYYGISNLTLEQRYFDLGKRVSEEVDLVGEGEREGSLVTVIAECKTTLKGSEMRRLVRKLKERVVPDLEGKEVVLVAVAMNVHPTAEEVGREEGVLVVPYSYINRPELGKREIGGRK
ncbi:MAG: hypothetical protein QME81_15460 [bacterium]|nr:hypothetical protein [bacterium]